MALNVIPISFVFVLAVFHFTTQSSLNRVITPGNSNVGITTTDETQVKALWILKNWTYFTYTGTSVTSPDFNSTNQGLTFRFHFMWSVKEESGIKKLNLQFGHSSRSQYGSVKLRVQFFFLSFNGTAILSDESTNFKKRAMHELRGGIYLYWNNIYVVEKLEELFPPLIQPNLPILINVWYFSKTTQTIDPDMADLKKSLSIYENQTFSDFGSKLLEDEGSMDVTLVLRSGNRSVHSNIIKSRSPATYRQLISDNVPVSKQIVRLPSIDISVEQLDQVIRFIYTDRAPRYTSAQKWKELLEAAVYLNVTDLQDVCIQNLAQYIDLNNASEWFQFAKCNNISKLRNYINEFWKVNANVMTAEQWHQTLNKITNLQC